ncbi:MAG: PAS domain-containing protein [Candidatus Eremiobacteraeota bacterium]|nr:PAS domain-containing protein [Candidatus Eremiobacteraeota bacterium]
MSTPTPSADGRRRPTAAGYDPAEARPEPLFDAFARLAARACRVPLALVSVGVGERERWEAAAGLAWREIPRDAPPLCADGYDLDGVCEIEDAAHDQRSAQHPLVLGRPHVRFYAAARLRAPDGSALGTLAVMDRRARRLTAEERAALLEAARAVTVVAIDLRENERSEQRIRLLSAAMEAAQDPIVIARPGDKPTDPSTIVYANEAFVRQKGLVHREGAVGKSVEGFFGPKTDRARLAFMRREILAGRAARVDYVSYRADGSSYHCEASARPLLDERGRTAHFVMVQRDVTEQVLRGAELTMQNERLTTLTSIARTLFAALEPRTLVDALLSGAHVLLDGSATLYAPRTRGGFAVTADLAARDDGVPGDAFVTLAARSDVCVLDEFERRAAVRISGAGGVTAYVLDVTRASAFESADLFALGLLGQYFAVAARNVDSYRELAARRDAVVELNQVKNDLIAMLAHDFKGPLTSIVGFADVLAEEPGVGPEQQQYLRIISSSALRLAALASDTLALSRLEQNELELSLGDVELVSLVRDVVRAFSVTRSIDLRLATDELTIVGDAARLRQVIENLVGNAIKYSPGGEPVEVTLRALPGAAEVGVRDRGIGIPEGERRRLFGRFARAENARALGIGGTGFGLYLAKRIVEMHGGTIDVESREGHGSLFRFVVPQRPPARRAATHRIALLDAEGDTRSYVAHALRSDGCAVSVASDGEMLLELVAAGGYDAAIVDLDRLAIAPARLLAAARGRLPLVAVGVPQTQNATGWDAFVTKPFLMADLYRALEQAVDHANGGASSAAASSAGSS